MQQHQEKQLKAVHRVLQGSQANCSALQKNKTNTASKGSHKQELCKAGQGLQPFLLQAAHQCAPHERSASPRKDLEGTRGSTSSYTASYLLI